MGDLKKLGDIGIKVLILFMGTTIAAATIGLLVAKITNPGKGVDLSNMASTHIDTSEGPSSFTEILINMVPDNIINSMAEGDMLQLIVFSIITGIALLMLGKNDNKKIVDLFRTLNRNY